MSQQPTFTQESLLGELLGRELSSIEFVRNYLQFRFDGPTLTVYTYPAVFNGGRSHMHSNPGYRDQLVSLIGKEVSETRFKSGREFVVGFLTGELLHIPLDAASRPVPGEVMVFDFNDQAHRTVVI